jgi:hypothetical protein
MAGAVATALSDFIQRQPTTSHDLCASHHDNLAWAVVNLSEHAARTSDATLENVATLYARDRLMTDTVEGWCGLDTANSFRVEFFPPAMLRSMALLTALPEAERDAWIASEVPADPTDFVLEPITTTELAGAGAHLVGLNFSRAWGLFTLYRATGERHFRDLYLDHMEAMLDDDEAVAYWDMRADYINTHWIAQFGVYAIALTYEE